ncbi:MAG: hypothetical protein ACOZQL_26520 [Myxococcota bacterium]
MEAPELLHMWKEVDTARASESAGSMEAGAGAAAKRNAQVKTVAIGTAVLAGAVEIRAHGAVDELAAKGSEVLVKGTAAVATDLGAELLAKGAGKLAEP